MNPTLMGGRTLSSWATPHIANWFYGGISTSSLYQSRLPDPHMLHVTTLCCPCVRLKNSSHVRECVENEFHIDERRDLICAYK
ncbi:hypothetical protein DVH24_034587 [Malus domestica]|uniref:Uncharacterized protein n=1 Tax=Malus domestica TaxID=3750 RepID=A0A498IZK5_MALDO|nr:hypothetical protein DVH24_034587 [Malus domestica]